MQTTASRQLPPPFPAAAPSSSGPGAGDTAAATALLLPTLAASLLGACGGSADVGSTNGSTLLATSTHVDAAALPISDTDAARFLAQASMGASRALISSVQKLGYAAWIDAQFAVAPSQSRWDWLVAKGYAAATNRNSESGFDAAAWRKLISSPDTLRQRVTLALSEIVVVAIDGLSGTGWRAFSAAAYLDMLEANAFGNYRTLLGQISTSAQMGQYLTFRGNLKANPVTGSHPDENYAREVMQLFTIGLVRLNPDGTPVLVDGAPVYTYTQDDVSALARVFTGWDFDMAGGDATTPDFLHRPMKQIPSRHETGASTFLGTTVAAGTSGADALKQALDAIFAHPNVGPFVCRQLIQRLVTSNPSAAYVARIAAVFNRDAAGVKGNLQAVVKALLLDPAAHQSVETGPLPTFGKMREPILRFLAWARAYQATSPSDAWAVGNTSDPAKRLGQSPLRSPSVFNFFRPGYVPPNSAISGAAMVAPEFQITNESSVVGYVNYMQHVVSVGVGDVAAHYSSLTALADDGAALVTEIVTVLAAGQISSANQGLMVGALNAMPRGTLATRLNRVYVALTLVLAAPEFIILK